MRAAAAGVALVLAFAAVPARAADLVVAASESLAVALQPIAREFEAAHPDTRVQLQFGAGDAVIDDIVRGAAIDVFIPADDELMDRIEPLMLAGSRRDVALNRLVVIVAAKAAAPPARLADLAHLERVALANPASVASGRYAKGALERAQLFAPLQPKLVLAAGEREVRDRVIGGEADAGFVYATDAAIVGDRVRVAFAVPTVRPVRYPAAIVRASADEATARAFIEFLRGAPAQEMLRHYGFTGR